MIFLVINYLANSIFLIAPFDSSHQVAEVDDGVAEVTGYLLAFQVINAHIFVILMEISLFVLIN